MANTKRRYITMLLIFLLQLISVSIAEPHIVELDEDNWHQMLENEWMVEL